MTDVGEGMMYASEQICIPPTYPYLLRQFAKAAIRSQPTDLLRWSTAYFRCLALNLPPPVKPRLEYPIPRDWVGITPGWLKALLYQRGKEITITINYRDLWERWMGVCLNRDTLVEILCLSGFENPMAIPWLKFIAACAGHLTDNLTQTMILICELLTEEPEGGSAMIPVNVFNELYQFLAAINAAKPQTLLNKYFTDDLLDLLEKEKIVERAQEIEKPPSTISEPTLEPEAEPEAIIEEAAPEELSTVSCPDISSDEFRPSDLEPPSFEDQEEEQEEEHVHEEEHEGSESSSKSWRDEKPEFIKSPDEKREESESKTGEGLSEEKSKVVEETQMVEQTEQHEEITEQTEITQQLESTEQPETVEQTEVVEQTETTEQELEEHQEPPLQKEKKSVSQGTLIDEYEAADLEFHERSSGGSTIYKAPSDEELISAIRDPTFARYSDHTLDTVSICTGIMPMRNDAIAEIHGPFSQEEISEEKKDMELTTTAYQDIPTSHSASTQLSLTMDDETTLEPTRPPPIAKVYEEVYVEAIPGIGGVVPQRLVKAVVQYMKDSAVIQHAMVMPRNIRHYNCPPLEVVE